jgi:WD40 repeat protein
MCLTGGYDGLVKIWKTDTGELIQSLEGPEDVEWAQWHSKVSCGWIMKDLIAIIFVC